MTDQEEMQAPVGDRFYKGWMIRWRGWIYPPHQVAITGHWLAWKEELPQLLLVVGVGEKVREAAYNGVAGWSLYVPRDYAFTGVEPPEVLLAARLEAHNRLLRVIDKYEASEAAKLQHDKIRAELIAELKHTDDS